jgi:hypothetical protein
MLSAPENAARCRLVTTALCTLLACCVPALAETQPESSATDQHAADAPPDPAREELTLGSVVIEAEPILEPGIDDLMRSFRAALERDRQRTSLDIVERQYASGAVEVDTRYGRFCLAPLPTYLSSDLTAGVALASRCARF